jgi:hypothetical protein
MPLFQGLIVYNNHLWLFGKHVEDIFGGTILDERSNTSLGLIYYAVMAW